MGYPSDDELRASMENRAPPGDRDRCPKCEGRGEVNGGRGELGDGERTWDKCPKCSGTGKKPTADLWPSHARNGKALRFRCGAWVGTQLDASKIIEHPDNTAPTGVGVTCRACHENRLDIPAPEFGGGSKPPPAAERTDGPIHFALSDGNTVCGVKVAGSNVRVTHEMTKFIDARGAGYACRNCVNGSTVSYNAEGWIIDGAVTLCPQCRRVHEGTAAWFIEHSNSCGWRPKIAGTLHIDKATGPDRTFVNVFEGPNEVIASHEIPPGALTTDAGKALQKILATGIALGKPSGPRGICGPARCVICEKDIPGADDRVIRPDTTHAHIACHPHTPEQRSCFKCSHERCSTPSLCTSCGSDCGGRIACMFSKETNVDETSIIDEGVRRARSFMFPHGGLRLETEAHLRRLLTEGKRVTLKKPKGSGRTTARALHYLVTGQNPDVLPDHLNARLPGERENILRYAARINTPPSVAEHAINVTHEPEGGTKPRTLTVDPNYGVLGHNRPATEKAPAEPAAASEGMKPGMGTITYLDVEKREGRVCRWSGCIDTHIAARGFCLKHYGEERGIDDVRANELDAAEERRREEGKTVPFGGTCGTCHSTLREDGYCQSCEAFVLGARKQAESASGVTSDRGQDGPGSSPQALAETWAPAHLPALNGGGVCDPECKAKPPHITVRWENAGGPRECSHGYAAGVACPKCEAAKQPLRRFTHLVGENVLPTGFTFCGRPLTELHSEDYAKRAGHGSYDATTTSLADTTCAECHNAHKRGRGTKDEDEAFSEPRSDQEERPNEDRAVVEAIRQFTTPETENPTSVVTDNTPMIFNNSTMLLMADSLATQAREIADENDPRGFKRARLYRAAAKLMEAYAEVAEIEGLERRTGS